MVVGLGLLTLYIATVILVPHPIIWSWYTGRWWVGCYIWYSEEGPGLAAAPPSPILVVPNVTAHPSTASVPITVLLYDGPLLCGFNVAIKRLIRISDWSKYSKFQQSLHVILLSEDISYNFWLVKTSEIKFEIWKWIKLYICPSDDAAE